MAGDSVADVGTSVVVAIYEDPRGMRVRAFQSEALAYAWKGEVARSWWEDEFGEEAPTQDDFVDTFFEDQDEFHFDVCRVRVEGS
jgi:hypothetical protein